MKPSYFEKKKTVFLSKILKFSQKKCFFFTSIVFDFFSGNIYVTFEKNEVSNDNGHKEAQSFQSKASIYLKM